MGAVGTWMKVLAGIFATGFGWLVTQPLFDFLIAYLHAMGGRASSLAGTIDTVLIICPVVIIISFVIWGFISATRQEDTSQWR